MGHAKENVRNEISRVSIVRFMAKRTRLRYKEQKNKNDRKETYCIESMKKVRRYLYYKI